MKTVKKKPPIQADQIAAIRRQAQTGNIREALGRVDQLIAKHPSYKPLYGLAWEIANLAKQPATAVERALAWTRVSPNSLSAWQALAEDAWQGGYFAIAAHAEKQLAALTGSTVSHLESLPTPFGEMRFEEAFANDTARVHMATGRFDEALAVLAGQEHAVLRNNLALIHFHKEQPERALAIFEENWRRDAGNLFSLAQIVPLRLWLHGADSTAGLAAPLKTVRALRSDDALAKVVALLMLADWRGADAAWSESESADFWADQSAKASLFHRAGALAAWHLKDYGAMSIRLMRAEDEHQDDGDLIDATFLADAQQEFGEVPDFAVGDIWYWFPHTWVERLVPKAKLKQVSPHIQDRLRECKAHPDYLGVVAELGDQHARFIALDILKQRAKAGDETARQALIGLLARPCGPDKVRIELRADLVEAGLVPKEAKLRMYLGGEVREIRTLSMNIHAEASPSPLPPESQVRLEKVFDLLDQQRLDDCIPILEALIARHPDIPMLYNNLAGIKEGLGHPDAEVEALLEKAHALDPNYLFAISGLARLAARRGEVERAKAMLETILGRDSYHYTEWRSILMTQIEMAKAQGELAAASRIRQQLLELEERFG